MEKRLSAALGAVSVAVLAGAAFADYEYGFTWDRQADWTPAQNPGADDEGGLVWSYGYLQGGGFESENPWYQQTSTMMTWDADWYGSGMGVWSRGDDASPPIYGSALLHQQGFGQSAYIPVVRWQSPIGEPATVDINGEFTMEWSAGNGNAFPNDVDFIVGLFDASAQAIVPLYTETFSKPTQEITGTESIDFDFSMTELAIDAGDAIIITHRAEDDLPYGWVTVFDNMSITLVPAPGAAALLLCGGAAAWRRRR